MTSLNLCPKDEFFNVLNLVATKKVKVRYCRTIKERLRPRTQEESLTPSSKPRSPVKRKAEEKATKVELRGSLCYLQSYKNKKKAKIKERPSTSPPSSKSLLSYLHHKQNDTDSSCEESDSGDSSRRQVFGAMSDSNGFSEESCSQSKQQTKCLKDLISGLEQEQIKEETETEPKGLEVVEVEARDVVMRMVEDFSLLSESDSEEEDVVKRELPKVPKLEPESVFTPPAAPVFSKPSSFQFDDRRLKSNCQIREEDLLLREMMARYEKLEQGKAEEERSSKFTDHNLETLVTRVRRESKIFRLIQSQNKLKRQNKGKILSRCNYAAKSSESDDETLPYRYIILGEESKTFSRLKKPSEEDILLARKMNKINTEYLASSASASILECPPDVKGPSILYPETDDQRVSLKSDSGTTKNTNTSIDSSQTKVEQEDEIMSMNMVDSRTLNSGDNNVNELVTVSCQSPLSTNNMDEKIKDGDFEVFSEGMNVKNLLEYSSIQSFEVDDKKRDSSECMDTICHLNDDQFDVEVSFCDNIEILEESNQTYFVLETVGTRLQEASHEDKTKLVTTLSENTVIQSEKNSSEVSAEEEKVFLKEKSENAEKIEDIQKFLLDSETTVAEDLKSKDNHKNASGKASNNLFSKESALKIISQSNFFVKKTVKNDLKRSKVQSFEEALHAAITPSKKATKANPVKSFKINQDTKKKSKSNSDSLVNSSKTGTKKAIRESSPRKSQKFEQIKSVDVVSKIMADQSKSLNAESKKHVIKSVPGYSKSSRKAGNSDSVKLSSKETPETSSYSVKEPTYEEIYKSLKNTIFKDKMKPFDQIISNPNSRVDTPPMPTSAPKTVESVTPLTIESLRPKAILPKPVPSHNDLGGIRGSSRERQETETREPGVSQRPHVSPHVSPVKRGEAVSQGYYTSPVKVKLESKPTMLPSVFPTFDSPVSSVSTLSPDRPILSLTSMSVSGIASILQSASKPTAVVQPSSRNKHKMLMPILPRPVPAALGCNPSSCGDTKIKEFVCNRCGENFKSNTTLLTHQQSKHFYENF